MSRRAALRLAVLGVVFTLVTALAAPAFARPLAIGSYRTDSDNENNAHSGSADGDMDREIYNDDPAHPIEFNINVTGALPKVSAVLNLRVYDVDRAEGEIDEVYLNGTHVGTLDGNNDKFTVSSFSVPIGIVKQGNNLVEIQVDTTNPGQAQWYVVVDYGELVIDGGGETEYHEEIPIQQGEVVKRTVDVPASDQRTFLIEWPGSQLDLVVTRPDGTEIKEGQSGVVHQKTGTAEAWLIQPAPEGKYEMRITGVSVDPGGTVFVLSVLGFGVSAGGAGSIRGTVFHDENLDGKMQDGETGIPGVEIVVSSHGDWSHTFYSGDDGTFAPVALSSAYYDVKINPPEGYAFTGPGEYLNIWISGNVVTGVDFGLAAEEDVPLLPATGSKTSLWLPVVGALLAVGGLLLSRYRPRGSDKV